MRKAAARRLAIDISGSSVMRMLIASYFMALSLGLFQGAEIARLAAPFLPENLATIVMGALVFVLAAMVMTGFHRRSAALVLALVIFWASYLTMFAATAAEDIGAFWRDLALIGGLMLTYNDPEDTALGSPLRFLRRLPNGDTFVSHRAIISEKPHSHTPRAIFRANRRKSKPMISEPRDEAPYREDFDLVRAS